MKKSKKSSIQKNNNSLANIDDLVKSQKHQDLE